MIEWLSMLLENKIVFVPIAAVVATAMIVGLFKFFELIGFVHNWLFQKGFIKTRSFSPKFIMPPADGDEKKDGGEFKRFFFSLSNHEKLEYLKFLEHRFVKGGFWTGFWIAGGIGFLIVMVAISN